MNLTEVLRSMLVHNALNKSVINKLINIATRIETITHKSHSLNATMSCNLSMKASSFKWVWLLCTQLINNLISLTRIRFNMFFNFVFNDTLSEMHILIFLMVVWLSERKMAKRKIFLHFAGPAFTERAAEFYLRFIHLKLNVMFIVIFMARSAQLNLVIFQLKFSKFSSRSDR